MDNLTVLIILFPSIFMIHEFEEIIWLVNWTKNNIYSLPKNQKLRKVVENLSTSGFSLIVFYEFLLVIILCLICAYFETFNLLIGLMLTYIIHSLVHLVQSIVVKKYVPGLGTALLTSIYAGIVIYKAYMMYEVDYMRIEIMTVIITLSVYINLMCMHYYIYKKFKD